MRYKGKEGNENNGKAGNENNSNNIVSLSNCQNKDKDIDSKHYNNTTDKHTDKHTDNIQEEIIGDVFKDPKEKLLELLENSNTVKIQDFIDNMIVLGYKENKIEDIINNTKKEGLTFEVKSGVLSKL